MFDNDVCAYLLLSVPSTVLVYIPSLCRTFNLLFVLVIYFFSECKSIWKGLGKTFQTEHTLWRVSNNSLKQTFNTEDSNMVTQLFCLFVFKVQPLCKSPSLGWQNCLCGEMTIIDMLNLQ